MASGCEGQRKPTEFCPPAAAAAISSRRGKMSVSGPGQNCIINFCAKSGTSLANFLTDSAEAT